MLVWIFVLNFANLLVHPRKHQGTRRRSGDRRDLLGRCILDLELWRKCNLGPRLYVCTDWCRLYSGGRCLPSWRLCNIGDQLSLFCNKDRDFWFGLGSGGHVWLIPNVCDLGCFGFCPVDLYARRCRFGWLWKWKIRRRGVLEMVCLIFVNLLEYWLLILFHFLHVCCCYLF